MCVACSKMESPSVSLRADVPKDKGDIRYDGRTMITRPPVKAPSCSEKKLVPVDRAYAPTYIFSGRESYIYICICVSE